LFRLRLLAFDFFTNPLFFTFPFLLFQIESFLSSQTSAISKAQQEHEHLMRDMEAKIQRLRREELDADSRRSDLSGQYSTERRQLAEKQAELASLERARGTLPSDVEAGKAREEAAQLQLSQTRAEYERREAESRYELQELTRGLECYQRLGLSFEKLSDDRLRLVFTLIDQTDPNKRFFFTVRMNDSDAYTVDECSPPIDTMADMVRLLNENNDFSRFVQLVRQEFKKISHISR